MDELESFIAESADEVRMYPSDRVWLNIDKRLRGERKWPALTFGAILTGAILLAGLIFLQPDKDLFEIKPLTAAAAPHDKTAGTPHVMGDDRQTEAPLVTPGKQGANPAAARFFHEGVAQEDLSNSISLEASETTPASGPANEQHLLAADNGAEGLEASVIAEQPAIPVENEDSYAHTALSQIQRVSGAAHHPDHMAVLQATLSPQATSSSIAAQLDALQVEPLATPAAAPMAASPKTAASRWNIQYYGAPSISYRILTEEKNFNKSLFTN